MESIHAWRMDDDGRVLEHQRVDIAINESAYAARQRIREGLTHAFVVIGRTHTGELDFAPRVYELATWPLG